VASQQSKNVVAAAFEGWARGDGDFFSILADAIRFAHSIGLPLAI
jgi:hypothetical protein